MRGHGKYCELLLFLALAGCCPPPVPTDAGVLVDVREADVPSALCGPRTDRDGDTITDDAEGAEDRDGDGTPNADDLDADEDGLSDLVEAGDDDCTTPPVDTDGDGLADYLDNDSDDDGASDAEEVAAGSNVLVADTDGDGEGDLEEIAFARFHCDDEPLTCDCVNDSACRIPEEASVVVLPQGRPLALDLEFTTRIAAADVFFLLDTTEMMDGTLANVRRALADEEFIAQIETSLPDVRFGGGQHDDFPFGPYGSPGDETFLLARAMTPPERIELLLEAVNGIELHHGGDGPEAQVQALHQLITGEGGSWQFSGTTPGAYESRASAGDCLVGYGAACFRDGALPLILHFTNACAHNGPPGESEDCMAYADVDPEIRTWTQVLEELNERAVKYVGINANTRGCGPGAEPLTTSPCYFLQQTALATGSTSSSGEALAFDVPDDSDLAPFQARIVEAVDVVATQVTHDVTARADGDAAAFVQRLTPACAAESPTEPCWSFEVGVEDSALSVDEDGFRNVLPGTLVLFRVDLENTTVVEGRSSQQSRAELEARAGPLLLHSRELIVAVPAASGG